MTKVRFVTLDFNCVVPEWCPKDEILTEMMIGWLNTLGIKVDGAGSAVTGHGEVE